MQRWIARAAGGTSQRLWPGGATVRSRSRKESADMLDSPFTQRNRAAAFSRVCRTPQARGTETTSHTRSTRPVGVVVCFDRSPSAIEVAVLQTPPGIRRGLQLENGGESRPQGSRHGSPARDEATEETPLGLDLVGFQQL